MSKTGVLRGVFLVAMLATVLGCRQNRPSYNAVSARVWNNRMVDSAVHLLRSGNIVLRMGRGADSYLLSQMNRRDKTYSHCGIVMVEQGYPFVYHSIGGEDNPDERLRRDSAAFFFSPEHNMAIALVDYREDSATLHRLNNIVTEYYRARPKFDLQFDLKTDDQLYCAEFVYRSLNRATLDTGFIKTTTFMGCTFVGIDALFDNGHGDIVWRTKFK